MMPYIIARTPLSYYDIINFAYTFLGFQKKEMTTHRHLLAQYIQHSWRLRCLTSLRLEGPLESHERPSAMYASIGTRGAVALATLLARAYWRRQAVRNHL